MGRVAAPLLGWPGRRVRVRIAHRARPLARLPTADVPFPFIPKLGPSFAVLTGMLSLAYPTVGALITSRLPKIHRLDLLCLGLLRGAARFTQAYADYALFENFALPGGGMAPACG